VRRRVCDLLRSASVLLDQTLILIRVKVFGLWFGRDCSTGINVFSSLTSLRFSCRVSLSLPFLLLVPARGESVSVTAYYRAADIDYGSASESFDSGDDKRRHRRDIGVGNWLAASACSHPPLELPVDQTIRLSACCFLALSLSLCDTPSDTRVSTFTTPLANAAATPLAVRARQPYDTSIRVDSLLSHVVV
jgi:hypothetical protein